MDKTIKIIRGTSNTFDIDLRKETGEFYTLGAGEILRFGVKVRASSTKYELVKELTVADLNKTGDAYTLQLVPSDTEGMEFRTYCYDIGLQTGDAYVNVVPCSHFIVGHNITKWEG